MPDFDQEHEEMGSHELVQRMMKMFQGPTEEEIQQAVASDNPLYEFLDENLDRNAYREAIGAIEPFFMQGRQQRLSLVSPAQLDVKAAKKVIAQITKMDVEEIIPLSWKESAETPDGRCALRDQLWGNISAMPVQLHTPDREHVLRAFRDFDDHSTTHSLWIGFKGSFLGALDKIYTHRQLEYLEYEQWGGLRKAVRNTLGLGYGMAFTKTFSAGRDQHFGLKPPLVDSLWEWMLDLMYDETRNVILASVFTYLCFLVAKRKMEPKRFLPLVQMLSYGIPLCEKSGEEGQWIVLCA